MMQWPGYKEYRKQVELRNVQRAPITMSVLVKRIARFVERFIEVSTERSPRLVIRIRPSPHAVQQEVVVNQTASDLPGWRVGPGFITKENIYIVGLVQVSRGNWQPSTFDEY